MTRFALAAFCLTMAAGAANAGTLYGSEQSFVANVTGPLTETTSFAGGVYVDGDGNPVVINSVTLADGAVIGGLTNNNPVQSGNGFAYLSNGYTGDLAYNAGTSETLTFSSWVRALGFTFAPDLGIAAALGLPNNAAVTFTLSDGQTITDSLDSFDAGDSLFIGFSNVAPGTTLTISVTGTDGFGNPVAGFAIGDFLDVPEPASLAALGAGVAALGLARRRRA